MDLICDIVDRDKDGKVSPTELVEFVHLFGPIELSYQKVKGLLFRSEGSSSPQQVNWFVYMNREEAEFSMRDQGTFRFSFNLFLWAVLMTRQLLG
jgi:hypothetical protein